MGRGDRRSAWSDALRYLSRRALTRGELRERLLGKGHEESEMLEALTRAEDGGFLDDQKVALRMAERYRIERSYGRRRALRQLRARLLEDAVIERAFQELEDSHPDLEESALRKSVQAWVARNGVPNEDRDRARLSSHLQQRGFTDSGIRAVLFDGFALDSSS